MKDKSNPSPFLIPPILKTMATPLPLIFASIRLICRETNTNLYHEALFCELPAYDFDEG